LKEVVVALGTGWEGGRFPTINAGTMPAAVIIPRNLPRKDFRECLWLTGEIVESMSKTQMKHP
jgi:hypothetical protein